MGTRQSIGGRSSFMLYLLLILLLGLAVALAVVLLVIVPDRQRQREVEAQRLQATVTAEAKASEVQRAYAAGVAFASAGDWSKAADEFGKAVSLDPGYRDAATRLADARSKAETAKAAATAQSAATATAQALSEIETAYQRGLGYFNLKRWEQAKAELEKVIGVDPTYKEVQAKLAEVEAKLAESLTVSPSPVPTSIVDNGDFEMPNAGSFVTYSAGQSFGGWSVQLGSVDHVGTYWRAARGKQSIDLNGVGPGTLYRDLPTIPGQTYVLHFAVSGNPTCAPVVKSLEVWWGESRIDGLSFDTAGHDTANMGWLYKDYHVVAQASPSRVRFRSMVDGLCGPALDDVSVIASAGQ